MNLYGIMNPIFVTPTMTLPFLETIGLTKKEAELYQVLLELGEIPAATVIARTKLKRATAYKVLYSLEKKGLVIKKDIAKKIHFRPSPPTTLLALAEKQYQALERARDDLTSLIPELTSNYILAVERPVISEFEGVEGLKKVFTDIYAPKKEPVYGCVDLEAAEAAIPAYISKKVIPLRLANKVKSRPFIGRSKVAEELMKKDRKQLRETILLDKKEYPIPAEIDVYEDKVALLSFTRGQFVGILIKNKDIATSLKSIFRLAFVTQTAKK